MRDSGPARRLYCFRRARRCEDISVDASLILRGSPCICTHIIRIYMYKHKGDMTLPVLICVRAHHCSFVSCTLYTYSFRLMRDERPTVLYMHSQWMYMRGVGAYEKCVPSAWPYGY